MVITVPPNIIGININPISSGSPENNSKRYKTGIRGTTEIMIDARLSLTGVLVFIFYSSNVTCDLRGNQTSGTKIMRLSA